MIDGKWLLSSTEQVEITVTQDMIKNYAASILEDNPIYYDMTAAKKSGFSDIPVPLTMPIIFWQYFEIPWLKDIPVLIHGKQSFQYQKHMIANQTFQCDIQLTDLKQRVRKNGSTMQIAKHQLTIQHQDELYGKSLSTLLILED